jgi:hypothetical protein
MRWTCKTIAIAVTGAAFLLGGGAAAAGALTSDSSPAVITLAPAARTAPATPAPPKTTPPPATTAPAPTKTVTVAPPAPEQTPNWQQPTAPAPAQPQFTSSIAVVNQYYQEITDRNYSAAWARGGSNLSGGVGYDAWVTGYGTTASITLYSQADWGSGKVTSYLSALQSDGSTRTYYGTYYVSNGVITSASIARTS